jgi:iron complex outermembrane receptor protein
VTHLDSDCNPQVLTTYGGNPLLVPERSRQVSAGVVLEPVRETTFSLDAWHIAVLHAIEEYDDGTLLSQDARFEGINILRGPPDPNFPNLPGPIVRLLEYNQNVGRETTTGVDVSFETRSPPTPAGRFSLQLQGTYIADLSVASDGEHLARLAGQFDVPRWQHTLSLGWDRGPWKATLVQSWRSSYVDEFSDDDGNPRRVAPYRIWDAQLSHEAPRWGLAVGVKNLLGTRPPFSNLVGPMQAGYDPSYADPRGRVWYMRGDLHWPAPR